MTNTILETVHGSHLYGMAHADSDRDFFRVVDGNARTVHRVIGKDDITQMSLERFLYNVFRGSHQSCEALFSPLATVDPKYKYLFDSMRVGGPEVCRRYERTIHSFSFGTDKMRRHAVRLGFNLADIKQHGRFNPVLTDNQKLKIYALSKLYNGEFLFEIAMNL